MVLKLEKYTTYMIKIKEKLQLTSKLISEHYISTTSTCDLQIYYSPISNLVINHFFKFYLYSKTIDNLGPSHESF